MKDYKNLKLFLSIESFKKKWRYALYEDTGQGKTMIVPYRKIILKSWFSAQRGDMITPIQLEEAYQNFIQNLKKWAPDGLIHIDLETLSEMGLLNQTDFDEEEPDNVTQNFHVLETSDKITLYNEKFAIWIVPKMIDDIPTTLTYVSQINKKKPQLELVFSNAGVYNNPKYILKVLEHFLIEVIDTDAIISSIGKKN